jgi:RNA polymerase sigma-70 factor (ECF subfamily)
MRRHAWHGRDLPLESYGLDQLSTLVLETDQLRKLELLRELQTAISRLTAHERRVLVALALNGVPIDVLAERLQTSRGALYQTLHDARRKLRRHIAVSGLCVD